MYNDPPELGESGGCVLEDEEAIILNLDEPQSMAPNKRARIIKQHTKE